MNPRTRTTSTTRHRYAAAALMAACIIVLADSRNAWASTEELVADNGAYDFAVATVPPTPSQLQAGMDDVLSRMPGAKQLDDRTILVAPGLVMRLPAPTPAVAVGAQANDVAPMDLEAYCSQWYVCIFSNSNYSGAQLDFYTCGQEWNLGNVAFPGGGYWNDKTSSIINNQNGSGATSYFYNHISDNNWSKILTALVQTHRANLALDNVEDGSGGNANDKIDGVHVCGTVPSPWRPNYP